MARVLPPERKSGEFPHSSPRCSSSRSAFEANTVSAPGKKVSHTCPGRLRSTLPLVISPTYSVPSAAPPPDWA
ncbi:MULTISPECIES: hypothetical protein [Serratia]|uniref:hypothetical protein n=1 Tax=Serratia TaxID=613 RepID=UPI001F1DDE2C|nr:MULTISPECIES: hypothetical protein [Serratia]MDK4859938.1 hypothetical protein [Serratia nevei]MDK5223556.1 hypothetical protein [Serratia nevei]MEC5537265.1 hypothetical protein [Serratia nevei]MEC5545998.1 hypothetical protein [Serratia nevei]MEC5567155.1 hypothetical protein [Serratia nevei]